MNPITDKIEVSKRMYIAILLVAVPPVEIPFQHKENYDA
jgi:hypothetical protein